MTSACRASRSIYSIPYLKANIEGGEAFNWYYSDGTNAGRGLDPNGSGLMVSLPQGDRLAQARNAYHPNQQILASKQFRWWWNNNHRAVYDTGSGWAPQGPQTEWVRAIEVDRIPRVRLRGERSRDQSAERLLRRKVDGERDALLVDLGPGAGPELICRVATIRSPRSRSKRSMSTGTRTANNVTSEAGVADAAVGIFLRLELGRAAIPDLPE